MFIVSNCKMYLCQIAKCFFLLKLLNLFVSNFKMYLIQIANVAVSNSKIQFLQIVKCICLKLQKRSSQIEKCICCKLSKVFVSNYIFLIAKCI